MFCVFLKLFVLREIYEEFKTRKSKYCFKATSFDCLSYIFIELRFL